MQDQEGYPISGMAAQGRIRYTVGTMSFLNALNRSRPRFILTVSWLETEIRFILWSAVDGEEPILAHLAVLPVDRCTAEGYQDMLREMRERTAGGRAGTRWIVLREAWRSGPHSAEIAPPFGIRHCWETLPVGLLPDRILDGAQLLKREFDFKHALGVSGTCLYFRVGNRAFLAGEGNGVAFSRLSRADLLANGPEGEILRDWFLQSRTLFRNRTGTSLSRILIRGNEPALVKHDDSYPIELAPVSSKQLGCTEKLSPVEVCLHWQAASLPESSAPELPVPFLESRRRSHAWERRLRLGACVLTGGWALLLVGACQNEALMPGKFAKEERQLERYAHRFDAYQREWDEARQRDREISRPFELSGKLVQSIPQEVQLDGLNIRQQEKNPGVYEIEVNGAVAGEGETGLLRSWIKGLKQDGTLSQIGDVKFFRAADRIAFTLTGSQEQWGQGR